MNPWLAYLLGVLTLPPAAAVLCGVLWAFSKQHGSSGCTVCAAAGLRNPSWEIGDRWNWTVVLGNAWHRRVVARRRRHRLAWQQWHDAHPYRWVSLKDQRRYGYPPER